MLAAEMMGRGETGSLVTLICDRGERYLRSYYDDAWVAAQGFELGSHEPAWKPSSIRAAPSELAQGRAAARPFAQRLGRHRHL